MSRPPGPTKHDALSPRVPDRTPGSLGIRDAADPDILAETGDTPGTLGVNDGAVSRTALPRVRLLPPPAVSGTDYTLYVPQGFAYTQYQSAWREAGNSSNSLWARGVLYGFATLLSPLAIAEEFLARPLCNVPFVAHNAGIQIGEHFARAYLWAQQGEYGEMTLDLLEATKAGTEGFNALLSVGIPIAGAVENRTVAAAGGLAGAAANILGEGAAREGLVFVEIGAGDLKAAIEVAKKGVKAVAVDPVAPSASAVAELERLGGQFVNGTADRIATGTADHVFQYFPWRITGTGQFVQGGTWRLVDDAVRILKPNGAAHFVTEEATTAEFLANEAAGKGLRAVITETTAGAAAPGASGAGVPGFSAALKVWVVSIYK